MDYQYRVKLIKDYSKNFCRLSDAEKMYDLWIRITKTAKIERREVHYSEWSIFSPDDSSAGK